MLKQRVLMAEKYENFWRGVRESKGESERLKFFGESEGKRLIPFSARKRRKKCIIAPSISTNALLSILWGMLYFAKVPKNSL